MAVRHVAKWKEKKAKKDPGVAHETPSTREPSLKRSSVLVAV